MPIDDSQLQKRAKAALSAIKAEYGTEADEFGGTLFVSHHLDEIESSYWEQHFNTSRPEPAQILESLVLRTDFDEEDDMSMLDFTLPGDVTNYVICVSFDDDGEVEDISMEG